MRKIIVALSMLVGIGMFLTGCNRGESLVEPYAKLYEDPEMYQQIKEYCGVSDLQMMSIPFYGTRYYCPACGEENVALLHYLNGEFICQTNNDRGEFYGVSEL